jgi:hypothetical protein
MMILCNTFYWTRLIPQTAVSNAIENVNQQDDCGYNELTFVVAANLVVEKQVCGY